MDLVSRNMILMSEKYLDMRERERREMEEKERELDELEALIA